MQRTYVRLNARLWHYSHMGSFDAATPWEKSIRTVLVDTNVLRKDVLRRTRLHEVRPSRLLTATMSGGLRILTPRHVVSEMDEHVRDFARKSGLDPTKAETTWQTEYRHKLVVIDVNELIDAVVSHPFVAATLARDVDDAPLAALAVILGQPALSEDGDLGLAGTGRPWLDHVIAVTDAVLSDNTTAVVAWGAVESIAGVVRVGQGAFAGLQRSVGPRAATIIGVALAGVVVWALINRPTREWILATPPIQFVGRAAGAITLGVGAIVVEGTKGDDFLRSVAIATNLPLPPVASLARLLATSRFPMSTQQIAAVLGWDLGTLERVLDAHAAFVPTTDGRWQFGRQLQTSHHVVAVRRAGPRPIPSFSPIRTTA